MGRNNDPWILGISASHNGAVCLLKGSEIVVSVQEERLIRKKRRRISGAQHSLALDYCLDYAGIKPSELSLVVLSAQDGVNLAAHDLKLNPYLQVELNKIPTLVVPHHYAHAVSAFATSGFEESAVLVIDGMGSRVEELPGDELESIKGPRTEGWEMISLYSASGTSITPLEKHVTEGFDWYTKRGEGMRQFRSLGSIFSAAAKQIFGESLDAGKVMGLAPYGSPTIPSDEFFKIVDGRFVFRDKVQERFPHSERWPLHRDEYQNLCCSAQGALEEALDYLVRRLKDLCPSENLCYAGGVALNSVANEKIIQEMIFRNVYIIPAAEDSGPAIGAAYHGLWQLTGKNERRKPAHDAFGREYSPEEIRKAIEETPGVEVVESDDVIADTVELLCEGKNLGWFQGRSELGPRALGQRSIICDPRRPDAKEILNGRVKHREAFRPFAPVILLEEAQNWFEWGEANCESPFMLRIAKFREDKMGLVPAVEHVDNTGRVQTVTKEANGRLYDLVAGFKERTGVPVVLNTSFNVMGMPIVETPEDALFCLLSTGLDGCVLGDVIVKKRETILLGADGLYSKPPKGQQPWVLDKYDERHLERQRNLSGAEGREVEASDLRPYAGVYQCHFGTVLVEAGRGGLSFEIKGFSSNLRRQSGHTFAVSAPIFEGIVFNFLAGEDGEIDRVLLEVDPREGWVGITKDWAAVEVGQRGTAMFHRVRPANGDVDPQLESLTGEYYLGDKVIEVALRDGVKFVVTAPGQPDYELIPGTENEFKLKNTPGYSVEFETDAAGAAVRAVVKQPNGVFTLEKRLNEPQPLSPVHLIDTPRELFNSVAD